MDEDIYYTSGDKPDMDSLLELYRQDQLNLSEFADRNVVAYNDWRNNWNGKSYDMRKNSENAFPWVGASDQEVRLIDKVISDYVAMFMNALDRANVLAYPIEGGDIEKARIASCFVKWMRDSYIRNFRKEMEVAANDLLGTGLAITTITWEAKLIPYLEKFDINEIAEDSVEFAELVTDETREGEAVELLVSFFEGVTNARARKAIRQMRKSGYAELPTVSKAVNRPLVKTRPSDQDVILPEFSNDPQTAPRIHIVSFMTPNEIENAVVNDGWDSGWADDVIKNSRGRVYQNSRSRRELRTNTYQTQTRSRDTNDLRDLVEVVYTYQRLTDPTDGSEGIYRTVYSPHQSDSYAKHELMSGMKEYPIVVTRLDESGHRMYDTHSISEKLRGDQMMIKNIRDGLVDKQSISIMPPVLHPPGRTPARLGAGAKIAVRPSDRLEVLNMGANYDRDANVEQYIYQQALATVGLNADDVAHTDRMQGYVNKFLDHAARVLHMAFGLYLEYGEPEMYFRVTGSPEASLFIRDDMDFDVDICLKFDVQMNDPDNMKNRVDAIFQGAQMDNTGRVDKGAALEIYFNSIDPILADAVLRPAEESEQDIIKNVGDDLSKIYSGYPANARQDGTAQTAIQIIDSYVQNPDIAQKLAANPLFQEMLGNYRQQYEFQLQQNQNAEIGRIGGEANTLGGATPEG